MNWVLINDEKQFGITVHLIDEGIDTGDIIIKKLYPISDKDNYQSLLNKSFLECPILIHKSIKMYQKKKINLIEQKSIHKNGFYCPGRIVGDEIISWNQNSRDIFNFIRAISYPGPFAITTLNSKIVKIKKAKLIKCAVIHKGIPGCIIGMGEDFFVVKTKDSSIKILEWESKTKLKIGDRFG